MAQRFVLVTGGSGQVGQELQALGWPEGYAVAAPDRSTLDLNDTAAIEKLVRSRAWAAVINAAAYTAVDRAESEIVPAWTINALAPAAFAKSCADAAIPLVQVSTDYVFPGDKPGAWEVDDPVAPRNAYGASKVGGELAVRTSGARHAIVRTAWVVSAHGNNFVKTMLRLGQTGDTLGVVADQHGSPTSAADLARALQTIAIRLVEDRDAPMGTFHFSNAGATNWSGFAEEIFRQSEMRGGPIAQVEPITTAQYPTPAQRPANSLLSHAAIQHAYGITPRPWTEALGDILDQLIGEAR